MVALRCTSNVSHLSTVGRCTVANPSWTLRFLPFGRFFFYLFIYPVWVVGGAYESYERRCSLASCFPSGVSGVLTSWFCFYSLAQEMGGDSPLTSCVQNIVVVSLIESLRLELSLT